MKKLILIRHGNTPKKVRTPQRGLTKVGVKWIVSISRIIRKELDDIESCLIISTPTDRAIQTANILASELGIKTQEIENLRIKNLGNLAKDLDWIKSERGHLCDYYWNRSDFDQLRVESPDAFVKRVESILTGYYEKAFDCIIVVTHEISLETIMEYSKKYVLKRKTFDYVTDYGDFAILESKSFMHTD